MLYLFYNFAFLKEKHMKYKRKLSLLASVVLLIHVTAVSTVLADSYHITASKTKHIISPGLEYTGSVEIINGLRREIYSFTYTPGSETSIVPAYGEYIYGFNSVGQLISSYEGDGRVVGGINTDFFITSTGIPLSCLISDREIISSCDNRPAIGFDIEGNAVIGYPKIKANFSSDGKQLDVAHINKTPAIWGMYLLTDEFSRTTRSTLESIEIVFRPFEKSTAIHVDKPTSPEEIDNSDIGNSTTEEEPTENVIISNQSDIIEDILIDAQNSSDTSNETTEESTDEENTELVYDFSDYTFTEDKIVAGEEIQVVVTEIRKNSKNSEIPDGSFVLCVPAEQFGYAVEDVNIGDEFVLCAEIDDLFSECKNIFGAGSIILENGEYVEQTSDSIYRYRNPRTAAGILKDGTVVFVAVDGRRTGKSEGFTAKELSEYMQSIGCISAVNFDGGGSTTFYAADIGEVFSTLKNTPSEGSERRVADGLIFINNTEKSGDISYGAMYPEEYLVYNTETELDFSGKVLFADENFHPIDIENSNITLSVDADYGTTNNTIFTPNGKTGNATVTAAIESENGTELFDVGRIRVTDKVNRIDIDASHTEMTPFDNTSKLKVSAYLDTIPVIISPKNIEYTIYVEKETDTGNTVVVEASPDYADFDYTTMEFVPHIKGNKYILDISIGNFSDEITIISEKMPYTDMALHWAARTAYDMYKKGFIKGEQQSDGNTFFMPERYMTKAEFCVLLARILNLEPVAEIHEDYEKKEPESIIAVEEAETIAETQKTSTDTDKNQAVEITEDITTELAPEYDFSDAPEWAKGYINALHKNGYLAEFLSEDEAGILSLKPEDYITRADVIRTLGSLLENIEIPVKELDMLSEKYSDFVSEKENDLLYFSRIISCGIISGYSDGTLRQYSNISRAEAATVFSRYLNTISE